LDISLQKIDLVRERTGLSYAEARELLEEANGDVIDALVMMEDELEADAEERDLGLLEGDMLAPVKNVIRQSNRTRIRVKNQNGTLMELPATLGLVGMIFAPKATVLGAAALLIANYSLEVTPAESDETIWEN
jgi:NACalpha-BTF3-like transcription factor